MKTPDRLFDYFTLEAGEQLEILEIEAAKETQPDTARLIAAARRLTGSARMARLGLLADTASSMERIAGELVRAEIFWTPGLRAALNALLAQLRSGVANVKNLSDEQSQRLREKADGLLAFSRLERNESEPIPISRLFFDDAGPHIVRLAQGPAATAKDKKAGRGARGKNLRKLLGESIQKLGGGAAESATPPDGIISIEQLLYRGKSALDRAREIAASAKDAGATPSRDELMELYDLLELAGGE